MRKRNIFTIFMFLMIFIVTGCGTKETVSSSKEKTESTRNVQETKEPIQKTKSPTQETNNPIQVKENTLVFSCKTNKKNTPGYQKIESVSSDTFFVSGNTILLDDTLNHRILVYENDKYVKEIALDWNYDVKQMFYSKADDMIKMVYEDLNYDIGPVYSTLDIKLEDGSKTNEKNIGDAEHVLLDFYFREDGKLMTVYFDDEDDKEQGKLYKKMEKLLSKDFMGEICAISADEKDMVFESSKIIHIREVDGVEETVLRSVNGEFVRYAVPEESIKGLDARYIKCINGNIYEMAISEDKIEIYILAEKAITKSGVKCMKRMFR